MKSLHRRKMGSVERLEKLAEWLDAKYETPIGVKVGWDAIFGLVPVVGLVVTTLFSGYIIAQASILGASTPVLLRMGLNIVVDGLIGMVPFVGWIGDFFWKANLKNIALLRLHRADPVGARRRSLLVVGVTVGVIVMAALTFALLFGVLAWILSATLYGMIFSGGH